MKALLRPSAETTRRRIRSSPAATSIPLSASDCSSVSSAGAEKTAVRGLWGSGVNQTAQVGYYIAYQNALAAIREKARAAQDKLTIAIALVQAGVVVNSMLAIIAR